MYLSALFPQKGSHFIYFCYSTYNAEIVTSFCKLTLCVALAAFAVSCGHISNSGIVSNADPFVGTGFHGHTYPGATTPFGMVQLSPDTRNKTWDGCSGYHYSDSTILGFSHTHISGTGCADLGDFLFLPFIGKDIPESLPFSHNDEKATPGYYKVSFPEAGITAELTATTRTGLHRYTFKGEGERHVLVDLAYNIGETHPDQIFFEAEGKSVLLGGRHVSGWAPDRYIFFYAQFSVPFSSSEPLEGDKVLLTFPESTNEMTISVGISQVGTAGAQKNLEAEVGTKDFDAVRAETAKVWAEALGSIKVEGGSKEATANFYSALYHCMVAPNRGDDVDGRYRDFHQNIVPVPEGRAFYSTLSLWDTFRSWNPLMTIINKPLVTDMAFSLLDMAEKGDRLPMWPLASSDTRCMIGYHAVSMLADAWLHLHSFDCEDALPAMIVASNTDECSDLYNEYGYIPASSQPESVSRTLEFAYDDWCIARMAEEMGKDDIAAEYYSRARRYANVFDAATGFMRGKTPEGNWMSPFNPIGSSRDFTEGIPWQFRFFVPHDFQGLTALMGGKEAMTAALDSLFTYDERDSGTRIGDMTGLFGQYAHGNEPSHNMTYLYNFLGQPSKSEKLVRQMLEDMYSPTPEGISGNEDCGQMSAWYVLSSLGIYPICPGTGEFVLSAPLFKKATLWPDFETELVITADHPEYPYIKSVTFNGEPLDALFITFDQLMEGGVLAFKLSKEPSHDRDNLLAPYSMTPGDQVSMPFFYGDPSYYEGELEVNLQSRTEGATIRYTLDGSEPDENSKVFEAPFKIKDDLIISAKAFKDGLQASDLMRVHAYPAILIPASGVSGLKPGCNYTYHKGEFTCTADVRASKVVSSGVMETPSIKDAPDEDHFGYVFTGYLDIPSDGIWNFAVRSDDGGLLEIDGKVVVDNDGSHSAFTATGRIPLKKGMHPFRLSYLEDYEGQSLFWAWMPQGGGRIGMIPKEAIWHK